MAWWGTKSAVEERKDRREDVSRILPTVTQLGWSVGTFAVESLRPSDSAAATVTEVWEAYKDWCARGGYVPLAYAVFVAEFEALAAEVGMGRRQDGANVVYPGVAVMAGSIG